jgi:hypothetical protein
LYALNNWLGQPQSPSGCNWEERNYFYLSHPAYGLVAVFTELYSRKETVMDYKKKVMFAYELYQRQRNLERQEFYITDVKGIV